MRINYCQNFHFSMYSIWDFQKVEIKKAPLANVVTHTILCCLAEQKANSVLQLPMYEP